MCAAFAYNVCIPTVYELSTDMYVNVVARKHAIHMKAMKAIFQNDKHNKIQYINLNLGVNVCVRVSS